MKAQEREASRRGFYISQAKCGIDSTLGKAPKKYAARYYQLKTGHGEVGAFLARIGVLESPKCWWCEAREQAVIHLFTECRRWRKERRKFIRELGKHKISWQTRVEKNMASRLAKQDRRDRAERGGQKTIKRLGDATASRHGCRKSARMGNT